MARVIAYESNAPLIGGSYPSLGGKKSHAGISGAHKQGKRKQPYLMKKKRRKPIVVSKCDMERQGPEWGAQTRGPWIQ
eukprot:scaffold160474_cov37-Tisochrysis_lutea.AAC.1